MVDPNTRSLRASSPPVITPAPGGVLIDVHVLPRASRAGLAGTRGNAVLVRLNAPPVDERLAYLTADRRPATSFAKVYRIGPAEPFSGKALAARLRELEAGDVVFKTRGSAAEPETLRRQLRAVLKQGRPDRVPVVFVLRLAGRAVMILGERFGSGPDP